MTRYRTIVADPPWHIKFGSNRTPPKRGGWADEKWARETVRDLAYPTMTVPEIAALGISDLAAPDAHLYIWTVNAYVRETYAIAEAWGFRPAQLLTWAKEPMGLGLGGAFTPTTEHVLFCRRGTLRATSRVDSTWWKWKRGPHSAKPEAFLDMVEAVSPPHGWRSSPAAPGSAGTTPGTDHWARSRSRAFGHRVQKRMPHENAHACGFAALSR